MKSHLLTRRWRAASLPQPPATLSNRLGKTVRFIGVIFVSLLSRLVNFIREQYRAARFTYQTGKWFERLDTTMQKFDGTLGSPSQKLDGMAKFVASEVTFWRGDQRERRAGAQPSWRLGRWLARKHDGRHRQLGRQHDAGDRQLGRERRDKRGLDNPPLRRHFADWQLGGRIAGRREGPCRDSRGGDISMGCDRAVECGGAVATWQAGGGGGSGGGGGA